MSTITSAIFDALTAVGALTDAQPAGLGFKVWDRWLTPTGPGATPEAFDATKGGRLLRNIVILEGGEYGHPSGDAGLDVRRWDSFPTVYFFAEAHRNGKAAVNDAVKLADQALHTLDTIANGNEHVTYRMDSRVPIEDSEAFPGNVVAIVRFRATGARAY